VGERVGIALLQAFERDGLWPAKVEHVIGLSMAPPLVPWRTFRQGT
jgi:hypothetical protein